jgi:26S proteasome regulatory subunit N9
MAKPVDLEKIANFLGETRDEAPAEVQHVFLTLEDLWERKLWHQLTETILEYYATPESESQRLPMYNTFILSFADKINQLKLVILGLSASQQLKGVDWPICGQDDYVLTVEQTPKRRANSLSSLQKE